MKTEKEKADDETKQEMISVLKAEIRSDLELIEKQLAEVAVSGIGDYNDLRKLITEINIIMIEGKEFGRTERLKTMGILEQWAESH